MYSSYRIISVLILVCPKEISNVRSQEQLTVLLGYCYTSPSSSLALDDKINACVYVFSPLVRERLDILLKFPTSLQLSIAGLEDLLESTMIHFSGFPLCGHQNREGQCEPSSLSQFFDMLPDHGGINCPDSRTGNISFFFFFF